jgi:hypothetical protein
MKQIISEKLETVEVDTLWSRLPKSFYDLKPTLYKDGNAFCCLLGADPSRGIFGYGDNTEEAIRDWDCHLNEVLQDPKNNIAVFQFVRDCMNQSSCNRDDAFKGEF